ncbi:MAG TPA: GMC family oxidoreductase, partial [Verrucomicrobiae bacterium]|nr:GMC family oxidoreductase [Verrucomicrobiae bacterium]
MAQKALSFDGIIIGSGAGGSTLAYRLAQRGVKAVVLERGDFLRPQPGSKTVGIPIYDYQSGGATLACVGGQTKFYGAVLARLHESDFQATQLERGATPRWPISYQDIEPYYCQGEEMYRVHGAMDPTEPPRSAPFPFPAIEHEPFIANVVRKIESQGVRVSSLSKGIDYGPNGKCVLCNTCDAHYCQRDAKMDAEIAALRPAIGTGNVELFTNTECLKILTTPDGKRATGVLASRGGEQFEIRAGFVAACSGIDQTPGLLWRSRSDAHPNGLGNATGCLGRYYTGHSTGVILPLAGLRKVPPLHQKTFTINEYYKGTKDWPFPMGVIQPAGQIPIWRGSRLRRPLIKFVAKRAIHFFYMTEALPSRDSGWTFHPNGEVSFTEPMHNVETFLRLRALGVDLFRRAGYWVYSPKKVLKLFHPVGSTRFGDDPSTSVADPWCQVHGIQ